MSLLISRQTSWAVHATCQQWKSWKIYTLTDQQMDRSSPPRKSTAPTVVCPRCECGTLSNRSLLGVEFPVLCQHDDCTCGPYVAGISVLSPFMDMKESEERARHGRLDPDGAGVEAF